MQTCPGYLINEIFCRVLTNFAFLFVCLLKFLPKGQHPLPISEVYHDYDAAVVEFLPTTSTTATIKNYTLGNFSIN